MSKKDLKKAHLQRLKGLILTQLEDCEVVERKLLLDRLCNANNLSRNDRNTTNQVIEVMVRKGVLSLSINEGVENVSIENPDKTISEIKKRKRKALKGKKHRHGKKNLPPTNDTPPKKDKDPQPSSDDPQPSTSDDPQPSTSDDPQPSKIQLGSWM